MVYTAVINMAYRSLTSQFDNMNGSTLMHHKLRMEIAHKTHEEIVQCVQSEIVTRMLKGQWLGVYCVTALLRPLLLHIALSVSCSCADALDFPFKRNPTNFTSHPPSEDTIDMAPLEHLVDTLLSDEQHVNNSFIPDALERRLYLNCLTLMFQVMDAFFSSIFCDFMGHRLSMKFGPHMNKLVSKEYTEKRGAATHVPVSASGVLGHTHLAVDDALIDKMVEAHLASSANIEMLPDFIERRLMKVRWV